MSRTFAVSFAIICLTYLVPGCGGSGDDPRLDAMGSGDASEVLAVDSLVDSLPLDTRTPDTRDLLGPEVGDSVEEVTDLIPLDSVDPCSLGCDDQDPCTTDRCDPVEGCLHDPIEGCCPGMNLLDLGFDGEEPLDGGEIEAMPEQYPDLPELEPLSWNVVEDFGYQDFTSLYFGDPERSSYDNGHRVSSTFRTRPVPLKADTRHTLSFMIFAQIEDGPYSDHFLVAVRIGDLLVPVWTKQTLVMNKWNRIEVDLSAFAGKAVTLEFTFDSHDEMENSGRGIYLDDILLQKECQTYECQAASDCQGPSACATGACVDGACVFELKDDCCVSIVECEDWDGCTLESCQANKCVRQQDPSPSCCNHNDQCHDEDEVCTIDVCRNNSCAYLPSGAAGCCVLDGDCNDNDSCTIDMCRSQACEHINTCCSVSSDCDDGDDLCTEDVCTNGHCYFMPTGAEGCCSEEVVVEGFEDGSANGWDFDPPMWEVVSSDSYQGEKSLHCQVVGGGTHAETVATLPVEVIPPQGGLLTFRLKQTMSSSGSCDENSFTVKVGQTEVYSNCNTLYSWMEIEVDLKPWAGQALPITMIASAEEGWWDAGTASVWVDSVEVTQDCCSSSSECDDGNPCTENICPGTSSVCQFVPIEGCCLNNGHCNDQDVCTQDLCNSQNTCDHPNLCCETDEECNDGDDVCTNDLCIGNFCQYIPSGASGCCDPLVFTSGMETGELDSWTVTSGTAASFWHLSTVKSHTGASSLFFGTSSGTGYTDDASGEATSPMVTLSQAAGASLSYWIWYSVEDYSDNIYAYLVVDGTEVLLENFSGSSSWVHKTHDISQYTGRDVQVRFTFDSDSSVTDTGVFIDDIEFISECCSADSDCNDANPCTVDSCPGEQSFCAFIPVPDCCLDDESCGDGDACTRDTCTEAGGVCEHVNICCETSDDCDDGDDVCTSDTCVGSFCEFQPTGAEGCCAPEGAVDDFETTSISSYTLQGSSGICAWSIVSNQGFQSSHSLHFGASGTGSYGVNCNSTVKGAAVSLPEVENAVLEFDVKYDTESCCDTLTLKLLNSSGTALLTESMAGSSGGWVHKSYDISQFGGQDLRVAFSFSSDGSVSNTGAWIDNLKVQYLSSTGCCFGLVDCDDHDSCTLDACDGYQCSHDYICCDEDQQCNDGDDLCTEDHCVAGFCEYEFQTNAGCCNPTPLNETFDNTTDFFFANSSSQYRWHLNHVKFRTGSGSLAFSNNSASSYGSGSFGFALSEEIELTWQTGQLLEFYISVDIDSWSSLLSLSLETENGDVLLATYTGQNPEWKQQSFDLSEFIGQKIRVKLAFNGGSYGYGKGVFLDDLVIRQDCCQDDGDCDDNDLCTQDSCPSSNSMCVFEPIEGCCKTVGDCNDQNPCTKDTCVANVCLHEDTCCTSDEECDDGDDLCTEDSCVDGFCRNIPTGVDGCCDPLVWQEDLESGGGSLTFENSSTTYKWHLNSAITYGGTYSLAYSNAGGTSYGNNNHGTAITEPILLPQQIGLQLEYKVMYGTETCCDRATVVLVAGGQETTLATYAGSLGWTGEVFDLSPWAGQDIQLKFSMDADAQNNEMGVFFDDLKITMSCCSQDSDCDDQEPCTVDHCPGTFSMCWWDQIPDCCTPHCEGLVCGDDGCGGSCGSCPGGTTCTSGQCQSQCGDGFCSQGEDECSCPDDCDDDPFACSSCECGGSGGECWCDDTCADYGDCCSNACDLCGSCGGDWWWD